MTNVRRLPRLTAAVPVRWAPARRPPARTPTPATAPPACARHARRATPTPPPAPAPGWRAEHRRRPPATRLRRDRPAAPATAAAPRDLPRRTQPNRRRRGASIATSRVPPAPPCRRPADQPSRPTPARSRTASARRCGEPVSVDGVEALPAGTVLVGHVTEAARSAKVKGRARVAFRFTSLDLPGDGGPTADPHVAGRPAGRRRRRRRTPPRSAAAPPAARVLGAILGGGDGAAKGAAIGGAAGTGVVLVDARQGSAAFRPAPTWCVTPAGADHRQGAAMNPVQFVSVRTGR